MHWTEEASFPPSSFLSRASKIPRNPASVFPLPVGEVHADDRGFFLETFSARDHAELGITDLVQDNQSRSGRGTIRGLHYQRRPGQSKLVRVARGRVWDVVVDIRPASATFGQHVAHIATYNFLVKHLNPAVQGLVIIAVLCFFAGLILDTVTRGRREMRRLAYLAVPGPVTEPA